MTLRGPLPSTAKEARSSASVEITARPLTRKVSLREGTRNRSARRGSATRLRSVSMRLLPSLSGIASVLLSRTRTKPGASPFGEQSSPPGPAEARTTKGEASMKAR